MAGVPPVDKDENLEIDVEIESNEPSDPLKKWRVDMPDIEIYKRFYEDRKKKANPDYSNLSDVDKVLCTCLGVIPRRCPVHKRR